MQAYQSILLRGLSEEIYTRNNFQKNSWVYDFASTSGACTRQRDPPFPFSEGSLSIKVKELGLKNSRNKLEQDHSPSCAELELLLVPFSLSRRSLEDSLLLWCSCSGGGASPPWAGLNSLVQHPIFQFSNYFIISIKL